MVKQTGLAIILILMCSACSQNVDKNDWLESTADYSQNDSASDQDDSLSNVGHVHTDHNGHR